MATDQKITCDQCGKVLNVETSYPADYGLRLESRNYGTNNTGEVYAVHITPPTKGPMDFCGLGCLRDWIAENA